MGPKIVMRLAAVLLLIVPALALGQDTKDKDDKVSNDDPARPLQMPPASTEVKEAIDDFLRFERRGAWERAFKALDTIPEAQAGRFVDGENGFIIPVARKRRALLAALSPQGRAAYRLFHDAEAKKLLEEADGPAELKSLERVYSAYAITSVGDNAADRLGDVYFELGSFDRAADCWLSVLRENLETDLSPALVSLKAALALWHAGRRAEFEQIRTELVERYGQEPVTAGGQTAPAAALLAHLTTGPNVPDAAAPRAPRSVHARLELAEQVEPVWQMRFADSVEAGMAPAELAQWQANPLSAAVPAVAVSGSTLFANYLGYLFALDLQTGKMLWRSAPFHHLDVSAGPQFGRFVDSARFAIVASDAYMWAIVRDAKDPNFFAPFHLECRRAETGELVWQSTDLGADYAGLDLAGQPLLAGGKLFLAAKGQVDPQRPFQQLVLAIDPHDGKVLWKTGVGTLRQDNRNYFYYNPVMGSPEPQLLYRAGAIYCDTHQGVLARLDADAGAVDWGYGYRTAAVLGQSRFMVIGQYQLPEPLSASSPPLRLGETLLVKGAQSDRLYALDPNRMSMLWERPIAQSARLLGASGQMLFLGGPELCALDLKTHALLWATRLPGGSAEARVVAQPEGLWQLTPRGIFEVDPKSGAVRRIFRGADLAALGGDLLLTDPLLLAVSNRTISAYPRGPNVSTTNRPGTKGTSNE